MLFQLTAKDNLVTCPRTDLSRSAFRKIANALSQVKSIGAWANRSSLTLHAIVESDSAEATREAIERYWALEWWD